MEMSTFSHRCMQPIVLEITKQKRQAYTHKSKSSTALLLGSCLYRSSQFKMLRPRKMHGAPCSHQSSEKLQKSRAEKGNRQCSVIKVMFAAEHICFERCPLLRHRRIWQIL